MILAPYLIVQEFPDELPGSDCIAQLALPDREDTPSTLGQLFLVSLVALPVSFQFLLPEGSPGLWQPGEIASLVPVPKTSVHEDHRPSSREDHVWFPGKIPDMETIAIPHGMDEASQFLLRIRILAPNPGHAFATLCLGKGVRQQYTSI
jgi:hypothetical protein